jgi:hypothetical protein
VRLYVPGRQFVCRFGCFYVRYRSVYNLSGFVSGKEMASDHSSNKDISKRSVHNFNENRRISISSSVLIADGFNPQCLRKC